MKPPLTRQQQIASKRFSPEAPHSLFGAAFEENLNGHLMAITPALAAGTYQLEITTQYGGNALLKEPRTAPFDRPLTVS